ncbi:molybdopterin biosynthesis protein [Caldinitratiruptor microaerophilus]|uniref:Molybdopterin molybdenumtransferase n=1 Tax=Caldinitratiruptor microaerophilus TaxID=671077 RepID=A0AA35CP57_9FIRM|nr:molybdopterin biosynthesis protein [Caldinitratiruptor microaerophilus]
MTVGASGLPAAPAASPSPGAWDAVAERRKIYLETITAEEAVARLTAALEAAGWGTAAEVIPVAEALGRVTAEGVTARISSPHYPAAAVDGIAVRAADTYGASETSPVRLGPGQYVWVDTGDPLPPGRDACIMVEDLNRLPDGQVEIYAAAAPWQNVRPIGEDVVATELVVPAGTVLRPQEIGALLATGNVAVPVRRRPVVTFIPTGDELVQPRPDPGPGEIIEFNSRVVLSLVQEWGGEPRRHEIVRDDYEALKAAVAAAVETSDIVVVNAGSSAGSQDYSVHVLGELGQVLVHGVAIRPGKPFMAAVVGGKPVLGLPGYPVSTWLTADLFLKPLVYRFLGLPVPSRPRLQAQLTRRLTSPMGVLEFVRVKVGQVGDRVVATPMGRGAGVISSLVRADGVFFIPPDREGLEEGAPVEVELLRPREEVLRSLVAVGSHDIILDLVESHLRRRGLGLSSAHAGSLGGLVALRRGEAHVAGVHMLDEASGEYNVAYVRRYLGRPARLVLLGRRDQGFMVQPGNPKGIRGFGDLARPDVRFVNRQRGAGTRILLDYHLKQEGVDPAQVDGYRREEFTHLAVAAAVASGTADCGLGIRAAARALGLDFVPVTQEEYELCIPLEHWDHPGVQAIRELLTDPAFRAEAEALGGYDLRDAGRVREV